MNWIHGQDPGADFHRPLGDDRRIAQAERVRRAGFDVCQPHRDAAHPVGLERHLRQVGLEVQAQVDLPQTGGRIGQVFQVFGTEIVISPVAQQFNTLRLPLIAAHNTRFSTGNSVKGSAFGR